MKQTGPIYKKSAGRFEGPKPHRIKTGLRAGAGCEIYGQGWLCTDQNDGNPQMCYDEGCITEYTRAYFPVKKKTGNYRP